MALVPSTPPATSGHALDSDDRLEDLAWQSTLLRLNLSYEPSGSSWAELVARMLLKWRSIHVQVSHMVSLPPTPPSASRCIMDGNGKLEDLARKHAAELASLQEAFHARLAALEEDLQVSIASLHCWQD